MCLSWPGHDLGSKAPSALPSRQRRYIVDRWQNPGYCEAEMKKIAIATADKRQMKWAARVNWSDAM